MFDVNNHPRQEELNKRIGMALAENIKTLRNIADDYNVDAKDLVDQYLHAFAFFVKQELTEEYDGT